MTEVISQVGLDAKVKRVHNIITEKHVLDDVTFDAWYTDTDFVLRSLLSLGKEVAKELRQDRMHWTKPLPEPLAKVLKERGNSVADWEDSPDGALAGMAILLSGWIANQSAAKTRDNPDDVALWWFDNYVRPTIISAMEHGRIAAQKQQDKK